MNRKVSPSRSVIAPMSAPHRRAAESTSVCRTGLKIEGRAADDLEHVGRRRLLLQRLARARRVRACTSSNRRTFSMAMTAWSAKVLQQLDLPGSEKGPGRDRGDIDGADRAIVLQHRHCGDGAGVDGLRHVADRVVGIRLDVGYLLDLAAHHRARRGAAATGRHGIGASHGLMTARRKSVLGHEMDELAVEPEDRAKFSLAQARRPFGDHVEHRLQIGRRARDDAEHVVRRRLLLQRFGQRAVARLHLVEQADVLDGDDRLVGEGLQQRRSACR